MPRTKNPASIMSDLFEQVGEHIARGLVEGIKRSGLLSAPRAAGKAAPRKRKKAARLRRRGRKPGKARKCKIQGCENPARSKGLCSKHYQQARYHARKATKKPAGAAKAAKPTKARPGKKARATPRKPRKAPAAKIKKSKKVVWKIPAPEPATPVSPSKATE
jgi:hypothetical protein